MKSLYQVVAIGCTAFGTFTVQAAPETFCVKPDGSGGCFMTIQEGVDAADNDGDTVKIAAGTYFEAVLVPAGKDGLTLKGSSAKKTIIDPEGLVVAGLTIMSPGVTVAGLRVSNSDVEGISVAANDFTLLKSELTHNDAEPCVDVVGNNALISGNRFLHCGDNAIQLLGDNSQILKNRIIISDQAAIEIIIGSNTHLIEGNVIEGVEDDDAIRATGNNITFVKNRAFGTEEGMEIDGENPVVQKNRLIATGDDSYQIACVANCGSALVEKNVVLDAADDNDCFEIEFQADGGIVRGNLGRNCSDNGFDIFGAGAILVEKNRIRGSGQEEEDGFRVAGTGIKTLIGNTTLFGGGQGFDISGAAHVLEGNKAMEHQDGFFVASDVNGAQLTKNSATHNGEEGFENLGDNVVFTANKANNNREGFDFCDSMADATGTVLNDNKFDSTATTCTD